MTIHRLWNFISFNETWENCDTSLLDDIAPSWFVHREVLQKNSKDYEEFINRLKRQHAIETGIVERMYDIDKGVTETLIKEGFMSSLISHGDANIPKQKLLNHLQDHLDAVDFIFDIVKQNRPLTKGFVCEMHQLTTRHQKFAEGRDQFGNKTKIPLLKGRFKERENNPTREDGITVLYCPPEHVEAEMDKLVEIYNALCEKQTNPLIIASWVHHAFTTIHPFQDGNGRVVRLIASLILIKSNLFPLTVMREDAKAKYITALEEADNGKPQKLVSYFAEIQRLNIEQALNIKKVSNTTLSEVTDIFKQKIKRKASLEDITMFSIDRSQAYSICKSVLEEFKQKLEKDFDNSVIFQLSGADFENFHSKLDFYKRIALYAENYKYFYNSGLPNSFITLGIEFNDKKYEIHFVLHHYGYDNSVLAIAAFLEFIDKQLKQENRVKLPLDIKPHVFSIRENISAKEKNIRLHIEQILTHTFAEIASEN